MFFFFSVPLCTLSIVSLSVFPVPVLCLCAPNPPRIPHPSPLPDTQSDLRDELEGRIGHERASEPRTQSGPWGAGQSRGAHGRNNYCRPKYLSVEVSPSPFIDSSAFQCPPWHWHSAAVGPAEGCCLLMVLYSEKLQHEMMQQPTLSMMGLRLRSEAFLQPC